MAAALILIVVAESFTLIHDFTRFKHLSDAEKSEHYFYSTLAIATLWIFFIFAVLLNRHMSGKFLKIIKKLKNGTE